MCEEPDLREAEPPLTKLQIWKCIDVLQMSPFVRDTRFKYKTF